MSASGERCVKLDQRTLRKVVRSLNKGVDDLVESNCGRDAVIECVREFYNIGAERGMQQAWSTELETKFGAMSEEDAVKMLRELAGEIVNMDFIRWCLTGTNPKMANKLYKKIREVGVSSRM